MRSTHLLPIGEVAKTTGIAVSAVRYYDEIGVITAVTRVGGKRRFDPETVGRVSFIVRAQEAGLSLDDTAGGWRDLVESKLSELTGRRDRIDTMIAMVAEIRDCGCGAVATCPLVSSF